MSTCKVCCKRSKNNPSTKFFRFPKDPKRCAQWASSCNLYEAYSKNGAIYLYKTYRICSDHFNKNLIKWDGQRAKLLPNAVPNLFNMGCTGKIKCSKIVESIKNNDQFQKNPGCDKIEFDLKMIDRVCRFCALERNNLTMLFGPYGKSLDLPTKVKYIPIEISENDVMPTRICGQCIKKVEEGYLFVRNCVEADAKLRIHLDISDINSSYEKLPSDIADNNIGRKNGKDVKPSSTSTISPTVPEHHVSANNSCGFLREIDLSGSLALQNDYADMFMKCSRFKVPLLLTNLKAKTTKDKNLHKFSCRYCYRNFRTLDILNAHSKAHFLIRDANGNFTCEECHLSFQNRFHLSSHRRRHFNEKPYECLECNARFYNSSLLRQHEHTHSSKQYECDGCKKVFLRKRKLLLHIQDSNHFYIQGNNVERIENYKCVTCTKSFSKLSSLQRHWKTHWPVNNFLCAFCGKLFTRLDSLTKHYRIHTGERPYSCYVCGFSFKQRGDCKKHEDNH